MNISDNERKVLGFVIDKGRITDSEIARKVNLSVAAISKIRKKLEKKGIIENYSVNISFKNAGICYFCIALLKTTHAWWNEVGIENTIKLFQNSPQMIYCVRFNEHDVSFIILYGFRSSEEASNYFNIVQEKYQDYVTIHKLYSFPINNVLKNSSKDLFKSMINNSEKLIPNYNMFRSFIDAKKIGKSKKSGH